MRRGEELMFSTDVLLSPNSLPLMPRFLLRATILSGFVVVAAAL